MQKGVSKIIVFVLLAIAPACVSAASLPLADSLYKSKQFTQAFEQYHEIYIGGHYTPAMLLKMAYIQEALGHLGESLYYLNLYYLASDDNQALRKMEEVATKNNLEGYETSETLKAFAWLQEQYSSIAALLAATCLLFLSIMIFLHRRRSPLTIPGIALTIFLALLFVHINYSLSAERGIVAHGNTYLMSGPSGGASVVAIVGEGHSLPIHGREDVWMRVTWKNQQVYVRDFLVRTVRL